MVCTKAHIYNDIPALALEYENYSKKWWSKSELIEFGERHCYVTREKANVIYAKIISAMEAVINDIEKYLDSTNKCNSFLTGKKVVS